MAKTYTRSLNIACTPKTLKNLLYPLLAHVFEAPVEVLRGTGIVSIRLSPREKAAPAGRTRTAKKATRSRTK